MRTTHARAPVSTITDRSSRASSSSGRKRPRSSGTRPSPITFSKSGWPSAAPTPGCSSTTSPSAPQSSLPRSKPRSRTFVSASTVPEDDPIEPWDVSYYAEKLRKARFDFDDEQVRPYFSVERVIEGLFAVVEKLYGGARTTLGRGADLAPGRRMPSARRRAWSRDREVLRRLLSARRQARRCVDEQLHHRRPARFGRELRSARRIDLRERDPADRRCARAVDPPRGRDSLPRVRSPDAPLLERGRRALARGHARGVGLRGASVADHGELDLGARGARPVRAALRDGRADPRRAPREDAARAHFPRRERDDASARFCDRRPGAAHERRRRRRPSRARARDHGALRADPAPPTTTR